MSRQISTLMMKFRHVVFWPLLKALPLVFTLRVAAGLAQSTQAAGLAFVVGSTNGSTGAQVLVPVSANQFSGISAFQFSFHWSSSAATFVDVEQFGLGGMAGGNFG